MANKRETVEEQIHDWLDNIERNTYDLKKEVLNNISNIQDGESLKKIQTMYGHLELVKKIKTGECTIQGFDKRTLIKEG